ncbi:MAG TPA: DUF4013 domain-containing protein [Methanocorpusculum sp.]|nr:DUF4013 domain-containing protein [Methanocorpusculum sp.]
MATLSEITCCAFADACKNIFKSTGIWLGLTILTLYTVFAAAALANPEIGICVTSFPGIILLVLSIFVWIFLTGIYVKPLRGEKADFKNPGKSFVQGILFSVIYLVWTIIPLILAALLLYGGIVSGSMLSSAHDHISYNIALGVGWVFAAAVYLLFCIIWIPAEVNFAKSGRFRDAFTFAKYLEQIQAAGTAKFLLGLLLLVVLEAAMLCTLICTGGLLSLIPVAGPWLGMLVISAFIPYFWIFAAAFSARLVAEANHD